jgi:hypothetical protein
MRYNPQISIIRVLSLLCHLSLLYTIQTVSTMTATARTTTSFIYYVMCLEARFYDYLASSDVKIK